MKLHLLVLTLSLPLQALSSPVSPIEGYQTSMHDQNDLKLFWAKVKHLNTRMKGNDCFKRANIWSYTLNKHDKVNSKKIFMHYTNKFNHEIDDMGRNGVWAILGRWFSRNKGWDFHVAPAVNIEGIDYVLDPHLRSAPITTEQWVEFLTERGEYRLKIRHRDLLKDLKKARNALSKIIGQEKNIVDTFSAREKVKEIEAKLQYLGLTEDPHQKINIKCKKITHIMEFDLGQYDEWCYYQETSMYYYGPLQLRLLNYGNINLDLRLPVTDEQYHSQRYFDEGRSYIYNDFDTKQLEESLNEFKSSEMPSSIEEL